MTTKGSPAAIAEGDILRDARVIKRDNREMVEQATTKREREAAKRAMEEDTRIMGLRLKAVREADKEGRFDPKNGY